MGSQRNVIDWTLKFDMDKNGFRQISQEFANLKTIIDDLSSSDSKIGQNMSNDLTGLQGTAKQAVGLTKQELKALKEEIGAIEIALNKSFNKNLGTLNVSTFNKEITNSKISLQDFYRKLNSPEIGQKGPQAFRKLTSEILGTNLQLRQTSEFMNNLMVSFGNTVKWGITSSIFNNITNSIQGAWSYAKKLDSSLNDIRIVTGKSGDEMERFAREANRAAASLGKSTTDYTQASLIYYQQGLQEEDVKARTETTLKTASVTGQSTAAVSEQLTAVWNGYKVNAQEAELYVDKLAAVAAATAADLEELSVGMSKVASAASLMGVDIDQLSAQMATIISVTRQAPESVGTALKTIYARMGDIEAGIDTETTLGEYTSRMAEMGINVLDMNGKLRDMGAVIEEIGQKWTSLTREQQIALSQTVAGTRQYNNLLALFDNWDSYTKTLNTSIGAVGTLQEQQDIYMESTAAHLEKLGTAWEKVFDAFFNNEGMNSLIDFGTTLTNLLGNFVDGVGGGLNLLTGLTGTLIKQYKGPLANEVLNILGYFRDMKENSRQIIEQNQILDSIKAIGGIDLDNISDQATKDIINMKKQMMDFGKIVSNEEQNEVNYLIKLRARFEEQKESLEARTQETKEYIDLLARIPAMDVVKTDPIETKTKADGTKVNYYDAETEKQILEKMTSKSSLFHETNYEELERDLEQLFSRLQEREQIVDKDMKMRVQKQIDDLALKIGEDAGGVLNVLRELDEATILEKFSGNEAIYKEIINIIERFDSSDLSITSALRELIEAKGNKAKDDAKVEVEKVSNYLRVLYQNFNGVTGKMKVKAKEANHFIQNESKKTQIEIEQGMEEIKNEYDRILNEVEQRQLTSTVIGVIGAVGQLSSALGSVVNTFKTLNDESLTFGEKVLQVTTTLAYVIPVFRNGWKSIKEEVVGLGVNLGFVEKGAKGAFGTTIQKGLAAKIAIGGVKIALGKLLLIIAAVAAAIYGIYRMWTAHNRAADEAETAARDLSKAFSETQAAAEELKKTISDYGTAKDKLQELGKSTKEYKEALEQANEQARALIENHKLLEGVDYKYKGGLIEIDPDKLAELGQASESKTREAENTALFAQAQSYKAQMNEDLVDLTRTTSKDFFADKPLIFGKNEWTGRYEYRQRTLQAGLIKTSFEQEQPNYTKNEVSDIVDTFARLREVYKDNYDVIFSNNDSLKKALLGLDKVPDVVEDNINAIVRSKDAFDEVAEQQNNFALATKKIVDDILLNIIREKYGAEIDKMATGEDGKVDEAKAAQIELAMMKTKEAQESRWAVEAGINGNSRQSVQGKVSGMYNWELNDKEKYGEFAYNIKNDEDLARTYAKEILGKTDKELEDLVYKNDQLNKGAFVDLEGNTVMNYMDDNEMRIRLAMKALEKQAAKNAGEKFDDTSLLSDMQAFVDKGEEAGRKMGTDFSTVFLDTIANQDKKIDFSSVFTELTPSEVSKLGKMNENDLMSFFGFTLDDLKLMGFSTAKEFKTAVQEGLVNYKWDKEASIKASLNSLLTEEDQDYKDEIETYTKQIMSQTHKENDFADTLEEDAQMATKVALAINRMNRGLQDLHDNIDDWTTKLKTSHKMSEDYAVAIEGISNSLGQLLGVDGKYINTDFVTNNLEQIKKAAEGDVTSIESLRNLLADDMIDSFGEFKGLDTTKIENAKNEIDSLQSLIEDNDFKIGLDFDADGELDAAEQKVVDTMNNIIKEAGLGVDEANALFSLMGFEATYEPTEIENATGAEIPRTITKTRVDSWFPNLEISQWTEQDGTEPVGAGMTVGNLNVKTKDGKESKNTTPVVKSAKRVAGNSKFLNKPTDKKGGGGSKKSKMDPIKEDINRFHDIDIVLGEIQNDLEKVARAQEKAFGKDLLEEYNKEILLLDKNIAATDKKIQIAKDWMKDLREGNKAKGIEKGLEAYGFTFDEDGYITNYEAYFRQREDQINALIAQHEGMSEGDAKEAFGERIEKEKDDLENAKELFEKYEELKYETIPEQINQKEEDINRQIEAQINKFNLEIEIRLDLKEAEQDWNEFRKNVLEDVKEDDVLRNAQLNLENFGLYYKDNDNGIIQAGTRQVNNILAELKAMDETGQSQVYGDNRAKALEELKTYYDQLKNDLTDLDTLVEEIQQSYLDMMGQAQEAFDEQINSYEQVSEILNHDMKIIQLIRGEDSYKELDKYYEKLEKNNRKQLDFQKQEMDFWKNQMDSLDPLEDKEAWEAAKKNWMDATDAWYSKIESSIEDLKNKYLNTINEIFDELNDKVTDGKGLDYISEEWDLLGKNSDEFLDEINTLYGIEDIARKYQDAIDNTDNLTTQKKLKEVMEQELKALREKDKLTEYDIQRAEKKYDLTLKQIALEEAQQNKSQLRLRRDSQGNYTYQYVADADEISKAEEELAKARNELYNFDLEQYKDKLEQLYDVYAEYQDKMKEAAQINDPEERAARELLLQQQYGELINGLVAQNEDIRNNLYESAFAELAALRNQELTDFTNLTQAEKDLLMNDLIPEWDSGVQHMADVFAGEGGFIPVCEESMKQLDDATEEYEEELDALEDAAGVNFNQLAKGIDKNIRETQKLIEKNDELIDKYGEELDAIDSVMDELDELIERYEEAQEAAEAATEAAYEYWRAANNDAADNAKNDKYRPEKEDYSFDEEEEPIESEKTENKGDGVFSIGETVTFIGGSGRWYENSFGEGKSGTSSSNRKVTITRIATNPKATHRYHIDQLGWVTENQLKEYEASDITNTKSTSSNSSSKKTTTTKKNTTTTTPQQTTQNTNINIPKSVLNNIPDSLKGQPIYLAQLENQIGSGSNTMLASLDSGNGTLEQNVHIDANFPNVQSSKEIEDAINNLTNVASQRAYYA